MRHAQGMSWRASAAGTVEVYRGALAETRRPAFPGVVGPGRRHAPAPAAPLSGRNEKALAQV